MRNAITPETPGKILLGVGVALTLFNLIAVFLMLSRGGAFLGMVKAGLWLLAVYAAVGAAVALRRGVRPGYRRFGGDRSV